MWKWCLPSNLPPGKGRRSGRLKSQQLHCRTRTAGGPSRRLTLALTPRRPGVLTPLAPTPPFPFSKCPSMGHPAGPPSGSACCLPSHPEMLPLASKAAVRSGSPDREACAEELTEDWSPLLPAYRAPRPLGTGFPQDTSSGSLGMS